MYSQNKEEEIILNYFKDVKFGHVLDIGANDGKIFSNSLALIESGWSATLVEPHPVAYDKLADLHSTANSIGQVNCVRAAICEHNDKVTLHINTPHIEGDTGLLSTIVKDETDKWNSVVQYNEVQVQGYTFKRFCEIWKVERFDFLTIDAEGMDYAILSQINLSDFECKMVCVEYNGTDLNKYIDYCSKFGMSVKHVNAENLIMAL
jgi:FkbM family methyltransferase